MTTQESNNSPTPNGGVRSTIYYQDDDGQPVDKKESTRAEIIEYDASGKEIHRTYMVNTK